LFATYAHVRHAFNVLQQQALPPKFKAWGPLKFDPDVGKLRCQVGLQGLGLSSWAGGRHM
jgi:hypothetical protein